MSQSPQVTLCIPLYNAEKTISRTLDSLIAQDYSQIKIKIKIFDNVSTDQSHNICLGYSKRYSFIELYSNETNLGAEANFTKCMEAAAGDYTAIVHSDDIYEVDFISKSVAVLEASPESVAVFSGALEIDSNEVITGVRFFPSELSQKTITYLTHNDLLKLVFQYGNFITCPSVLVRSSVYRDKVKNWNGEKYKTSADLDVWLRLSRLGNLAAISTPLMKYRVADASYSYRIAKKRTTRHDLFLVLDQYINTANASDAQFLKLKDQAVRSLNLIRNKKYDESFPEDEKFNFPLVVKKMGHSKWHFKIGLAILGIKTITNLLKLIGWSRR